MLSTFSGLNTMVNGIQTNRVALNTVGHNISNSNTTGYSRQIADSAATASQTIYTLYGQQEIGTGVSINSIARARDIYADRQYWKENGNNGYYNAMATNYSKIETIFNDSDDNGLQNAMETFYQTWSDCSTTASTAASRQSVINAGFNFAETLQTAGTQVQEQITSLYESISLNVDKINSLTDEVVKLNSQIVSMESTGASANDLRDARDNAVDTLSSLVKVSVNETSDGMYTLVSNGTTLVNGVSKITLQMSDAYNNAEYGISDYTVMIKETQTPFDAGGGELKAQFESIQEDKEYIDDLARMAAFMLDTLNAQHRAGANLSDDSNKQTGINFYGEAGTVYAWDEEKESLTVTDKDGNTSTLKGLQIVEALNVNEELTATDGQKLLATKYALDEKGNNVSTECGSADGTNAVWISTLFNCDQKNTGTAYVLDASGNKIQATDDDGNLVTDASGDPVYETLNSNYYKRAIGTTSLYNYYNATMTTLGSATENMNDKVDFQENVMTQVDNLRTSTSGVNWDEELTNMIMYQQGYSACSRCLNAMDEMLDKLVNSTGTVGR